MPPSARYDPLGHDTREARSLRTKKDLPHAQYTVKKNKPYVSLVTTKQRSIASLFLKISHVYLCVEL